MRRDDSPSSGSNQESLLTNRQQSRTFLRVPIEFWGLGLVTLVAFLIRSWSIGGKGLWYDEAATALMSSAAPAEIVRFHWRAAFEHPPLWAIFMHVWSTVFGQSEAALRWPAAVAGTLLVPLVWQTLRSCRPADWTVRLLAALFVALSPVLILYSQEARMYSIVTLLAMSSICLFLSLTRSSNGLMMALLVLVNWLMLGFHYYSVLLIVAEAVCFLTIWSGSGRQRSWLAVSLALSLLPLLLWVAFSPGFQMTLRIVSGQSTRSEITWRAFGDRFWRELTFGSVVWLPRQAMAGYLLSPVLLVGLYASLRPGDAPAVSAGSPAMRVCGRLFGFVFLLPVMASLIFPDRISTRYILFVAPVFYILLAAGIRFLWRKSRVLGGSGLLVVMVVAILGLSYYFTTYQKSGYRDMARYLVSQGTPGDAILIEGPRQHLLAKYYLPADRPVYPIPDVALPAHWPVTAPPIAPEMIDDYLRIILRQHGQAWLLLAGQSEVDPNGFVPRFLTAISFSVDCKERLDVRMCHYVDPGYFPASLTSLFDVTFGEEFQLTGAQFSYPLDGPDARRYLLVTLDWMAKGKPSLDYTLTLRLLDQQGKIQAQTDGLPIGLLLPPTTWSAGDRKPGFMTMSIPEGTPPGDYEVVLGVYNPATGSLFEPFGLIRAFGRLCFAGPCAIGRIRDSERVRKQAVIF